MYCGRLPGVAYQFDKGSRYSTHDYAYGCNVECGTCGYVNPEGKHNYIWQIDVEDKEYHISKCRCGEVEKDESGNPVKEKHHGGKATCFIGAKCEVCDEIYTEKMEHRYIFTNPDASLGNVQFKICYYCGTEDTSHRHIAEGGTATCNRRAVCTHEGCGWEYGDFINHTFSDGKCTVCGADEVINRVVIEVPYFTKGTPVKALEYPIIKEGRVSNAINSNFASYSRRDGGGEHVDKNGVIEQTVVMRYSFFAQANCKINSDVNKIDVVAENGEVVYKEYTPSNGYFTVCVLLRLDNTVPSVEIEVPQPYGGNDSSDFKIIEKNGMEVTVLEWSGLSNYYTGNFIEGQNAWALLKITAPEGEKFPPTVNQVSMWLSEMHLSGAGFVVDRIDVNDEGTEATIRIELSKALSCPHKESTLKEAGKPETCTENGVKDKYACKSCGKEFVDVECTTPWTIENAIIPAGHKCNRIEHTDVASGKDGNIEYYKCQREECGKLFSDATCSSEITLVQTVIHDFKTEWSSNNENHYHECKNCDAKKDIEAHVFGEWIKEVAPTVDDFGIMAHKDCTVCGKHFDKDGNEITDLRIAKIGTYNVVINGESEFYADGESVTVTAEDKEGKIFKGWQDETGKIISTDKSYTFTVTGGMTLTAIYEDVLAVKKGLSSGQITGIVIGSVAVAGIGAFSIFWFAVKKKSFANLGVALKNGFMAIGNFFKNIGAKIKSLFTKKK